MDHCSVKVILSDNKNKWQVFNDNYLTGLFDLSIDNIDECEMLEDNGNQQICYFKLNNHHWIIKMLSS